MKTQYKKLGELQKFLKVKKSPIAGRGLFTLRNFEKGEVIFRGGRSEGCYLIRHLNHSCCPNAKFTETNSGDEYGDILKAIKNIKPGQELTFDFRGTRWAEHYWPIVRKKGCRCQACSKKAVA